MKRGIAHLPLHHGRAPRWLFQRMVRLARQIVVLSVTELGSRELLRKLADPFWFQALGCVLGFDWHSSGLTTTACGAIKEGVRGLERHLGFFVGGGKGAASRKTPEEIEAQGAHLRVDPSGLVAASRLAAKVDSAALQDGYQLYHHTFFFTADGHWAVVQQGMNEATRYARRYHWLSETVADPVNEPHQAVCCDRTGATLNLVARESAEARRLSVLLSRENPERLVRDIQRMQSLTLPARHGLRVDDIHPRRLFTVFLRTYERQPENFEALLRTEGVGAKTLRALSLVAELIYGVPASTRDPARFSFAHGGKDGHPYPVDRATYDTTIAVLEKAVHASRLGRQEELAALRRLERFWRGTHHPAR